MNTFEGFPVVTTSFLPEFTAIQQLSLDVDVSPKFRAWIDQYLREFFGAKRTIYFNKALGQYIMHPHTLRAVEMQLCKERGIVRHDIP